MIVSIDWLKDFVDIDEQPEELAELLSSVGLEAEYGNQFSEIKNVIIGKVLSLKGTEKASGNSIRQNHELVEGIEQLVLSLIHI